MLAGSCARPSRTLPGPSALIEAPTVRRGAPGPPPPPWAHAAPPPQRDAVPPSRTLPAGRFAGCQRPWRRGALHASRFAGSGLALRIGPGGRARSPDCAVARRPASAAASPVQGRPCPLHPSGGRRRVVFGLTRCPDPRTRPGIRSGDAPGPVPVNRLPAPFGWRLPCGR